LQDERDHKSLLLDTIAAGWITAEPDPVRSRVLVARTGGLSRRVSPA
jgi:hypothetical protein